MSLSISQKRFILNLISIIFVLFLIPVSFYYAPEKGLDASWQIAMNLAYKYHLTFGKDICFTYGPLSIFYTRLPINVNFYVYLIFDLYFSITVFLIIKEIISKHFNTGVILFILLCILLNMRTDPSLWFYFFTIYYLFNLLEHPNNNWPLLQSAIFSIIGFYFKVSLGICGIIIFLICLTYLLLIKRIKLFRFLFIIVSYSLLFWLTSLLLHTYIPGYIKASLQLINSYNDGMFVPIDTNDYWILWVAIITIAILISTLIFHFIHAKKKHKHFSLQEAIIYFVLIFSSYLNFKNGFVRGIDHVHSFFSFSCIISGLFFLYIPMNSKRIFAAICSWITIILSFIVMDSFYGSHLVKDTLTFNFVGQKTKVINNYINNLIKYNEVLNHSNSLDTAKNDLKTIIGNGTVDVIPNEISTIYFNGLHYNPRPVIQTYCAYNSYLDSLNYLKYMSDSAPDYILFSLESIDYKYPFFEESKTKMAILNRYSIIKRYDDFLILKKKSNSNYILKKLDQSDEAEYNFGQDIPIKYSDNLQYSYVTINYNFWGKVRRFLYQPPLLKVTFTLQDGETKTYKAIKPDLIGGVILNKFISGNEDFEMLMKSEGKMNATITKVRFETDGINNDKGFESKIVLRNTYYSFLPKQKSEQYADSVYLSDQMKRYQVRLEDSLTFNEAPLKIGIDDYKNYSGLVEISGWAFRENGDNKNCSIKVILKSSDHLYELPTNSMGREDLISVFKRNDLVKPGFTAKGNKNNLPPGTYKIGIMLSDKSQNLVQFLSDFKVSIPSKPEKIISGTIVNDTSKIEYNLETIQDNGNEIHVGGWSFIKQRGSEQSKTNIILQNPSATYRIKADVTIRKDVSDYFKNKQLDSTGFNSTIYKEGLPAGHYNIIIEKIDGNKSYHILTTKTVEVK